MKDPLIDNLAARFADHTSPVDPGTWTAISEKLAVATGSSLSGMLQEKFAGHEAPVDPQVWSNISSQLGQGAAAGAGSTLGWWAAGIAATVITGGLLVFTLTPEPQPAATAEHIAPPPRMELITTPPERTPVTTPEPAAQELVVNTELKPSAAREEPSRTPKTQATPPVSAKERPSGADDGAPAPSGTAANAGTQNGSAAPPTEDGERTVNQALQNVVDKYVTSPLVVVTEKKVPPPTQEEMPSQAVHPSHDEPAADEPGQEAPELPAVVPAPTFEVLIPTAFSPNTDGVNDDLVVSVPHYQKAVVRIFSATSNALVFSADNLEARWNGRVMNSGQPCEPGMYFYALEITDDTGHTWSKGEVVRLFR